MVRRRLNARRFLGRINISVGNKITECDSDTLSVYLLNFVEKYSFTNEVVDMFFYLIKAKNKKNFLKKIFDFEIKKMILQKKLHFLDLVKKSISEKMQADKNLDTIYGKDEEKENSLIDYFIHNRSEIVSELDTPFSEDRNIFYEVRFRVTSENEEDFARILVILGEKEIRKIMAISLLRRQNDDEEISESEIEKLLGHSYSIPNRVEKNFFDFSALKIVIDYALLNENEAALFKLFYFQRRFEIFHDISDNVNAENWPSFYSTLTGIPESEITHLLRKDRPLVFYGLVKKERCKDFYELSDDVSTCISAGDMSSFFTSVLTELEVKPYPLESFACKEEDEKIVQKLLTSGQNLNILLYGAPGTGKTEFAKSVISSVGKKVLMFKNDLELDENENAICSLNRISAVNQGKDSVIVVDESDKILATGNKNALFGSVPSEQKGPINKMLEDSKNQIIWITNYTNQIDESTKRRFTFSLEFNPMPEKTLKEITKSKIADIEMSDRMRNEITDLCTKYKVTGASIENVRKMLLSMKSQNENESGKLSDLDEKSLSEIKAILVSNSTLLNGKVKLREKQCAAYDMSVLNTSIEAEKIVKMIMNAKLFSEKNKGTENGIRMLFYGLSGTGKTEFARCIAGKLEKKICIKRASDIFGKYVGENEKNISNAFREAESSGDILLFDEVDSFIADRDGANNSWERSSVNEFLTQMEEFSGILICTTNLKEILDPAINRRFHILCKFNPLCEEGIRKLLERYFSGVEFTERQIRELSESSSVTPGDFGILASRLRFMDEDELSAENITNELFVMQMQKKNSDLYERKIGFAS